MSSAADSTRATPTVQKEPMSYGKAAAKVTFRWFMILVGALASLMLPSYFWVSKWDIFVDGANDNLRFMGGCLIVFVGYALVGLTYFMLRDKWREAVSNEMDK